MLDKEQETENKKQKLLTISEKEEGFKDCKPEREDIGKVWIYESEKCYNGKQEEVHTRMGAQRLIKCP